MIFVSSYAFRGHSVSEVVNRASACGVRNIELTAGMLRSDAMREEIGEAKADGIRFLTHNYFPPPQEHFVLNLASDDENIKQKSLKMAREAMEIAHEVGAPFHSMHAGFAVNLTPDMLGRPEAQAAAFEGKVFDRELAYDRMVQTACLLADEAAAFGIDILFENNVIASSFMQRVQRDPLLLTSPDEAIRFVKDVARDNVGLLVDVGHANVSASALGFDRHRFLTDAAPYIRALHLSGNDDKSDSNNMFGSDDWFAPHLTDFSSLPMVIEVYGIDAEAMRRQIDIVQTLAK